MRNLELDYVHTSRLSINFSNITRIIKTKDESFILSGENAIRMKNGNNVILKSNAKSIDWLPLENTLYMSDGHQSFDCFHPAKGTTTNIEVPGGYVAHRWNPSQDRIAVIDKHGMLRVIMIDPQNLICNTLGQYNLFQQENSPFVNVGWGSTETQFSGSEKKKQASKKDEAIAKKRVDNSYRIAWCLDVNVFAVNFVWNEHRILKVFSQDCEYLFQNEFKLGLCKELAWKPDGTLLAVEQYTNEARNILFFEKNGLSRYALEMDDKDMEVKKILWNITGEVLMIWQCSSAVEKVHEIMLWTCSNSKWFLKQKLVFSQVNSINNVFWVDKYCLEVITVQDRIHYNWKWIIHSDTLSNEFGTVAVIDGKSLGITNLRKHIIPPPYNSYGIKFKNSVNFVTFSSTSNILAVVLDDYTVKLFELFETYYTEGKTFKISNNRDIVPLSLHHFIHENLDSVLYYVESFLDGKSSIRNDKLQDSISASQFLASPKKILSLNRVITPKSEMCYLAMRTYDVVSIFNARQTADVRIPEFQLTLSKKDVEIKKGRTTVLLHNNVYHIFSLNGRNLFHNAIKIGNNITSYLFYQNYFLLTTTENTLLCVKLTDKGLAHFKQNTWQSQVFSRNIPNGAVLINAIPNSNEIVLQVPTGELETINLRIIAIAKIDRLLDEEKYHEAFRVMRINRITPNLFYDINPIRFLNCIDKFVLYIDNCDYIDEFLSQLQNHNVTQELYAKCFEDPLPVHMVNDKLTLITDRFIDAMKRKNLDHYLQSIVTAYVCKGTNQSLTDALNELFAAKKREEKGEKLRMPVDTILEHMVLLNSVAVVYDAALGMDNIELVMWVASKANLNPGEHVPFLLELMNTEENYRKFKINCHIKRYENAFIYLIKCDNVQDELKEFIRKHNLYRLIPQYLKPVNQWYKILMQVYAEYLQSKNQYKEAAIVFTWIKNYAAAAQNYIKANCLIETLIAVKEMASTPEMTIKYFLELGKKLIESENYKDAAFVYDSCLNNCDEAVRVLIKGSCWTEAYFAAVKHSRRDLVENDIKLAVSLYAENLLLNIGQLKVEFNEHKTRLQVLRTKKVDDIRNGRPVNNENAEETSVDCVANDFDIQSVASTSRSTVTERSTLSNMTSSTKRRKRLERKVITIKKDSMFENIGIIRRLHLIFTETENMITTIKETCAQLFEYSDRFEKAIKLQNEFENLMDSLTNSVDFIWPNELLNPPNPPTIESLAYRQHIELLEVQYRFPPKDIKKNWKSLFSDN